MLLEATLAMWAPGERIRREPTFWDRVRRVVGPKRDEADPDAVRSLLTAAALVGGAEQALDALGIHNAIALVVDGDTVFEDRHGRPDDLEALLGALHNVARLATVTGQHRSLELAVEHVEDGLHHVVVLAARGVHATDEASGEVRISSRVVALRPADGELDLDFLERVARTFPTAVEAERYLSRFRDFVERVARALRAALPDVRIGAATVDVRVRRPAEGAAASAASTPAATALAPFERYCPEPRQALIDEALWTQVRRWGSVQRLPAWVVVGPDGQRIGSLRAFAPEVRTHEPFAPTEAWTFDGWSGTWAEADPTEP